MVLVVVQMMKGVRNGARENSQDAIIMAFEQEATNRWLCHGPRDKHTNGQQPRLIVRVGLVLSLLPIQTNKKNKKKMKKWTKPDDKQTCANLGTAVHRASNVVGRGCKRGCLVYASGNLGLRDIKRRCLI
jgi:hypothetical protein